MFCAVRAELLVCSFSHLSIFSCFSFEGTFQVLKTFIHHKIAKYNDNSNGTVNKNIELSID